MVHPAIRLRELAASEAAQPPGSLQGLPQALRPPALWEFPSRSRKTSALLRPLRILVRRNRPSFLPFPLKSALRLFYVNRLRESKSGA
jgi:hypothetical protein